MTSSASPLEERLYQFMRTPSYQPMKKHELISALELPTSRRRDLRHALLQLERQGKIVSLRKNRWAIPHEGQYQEGVLSVHAKGFGFVIPSEPGKPDIFIAKKRMGTALHLDRVLVTLRSDESFRAHKRGGKRKKSGKKAAESAVESGTEGQITRVLERRTTQLAGLLQIKGSQYSYVIPDNPRIPHSVRIEKIHPDAKTAKNNHRVVVSLHPWDDPGTPLSGEIIEDLGHTDDTGVDMLSLIRGHGLSEEFPEDVLREAEHADPQRIIRDEPHRRDIRQDLIFTIDPEDARDFDDAVSLKPLSDGGWELGVHIADVSSYVRPGTALDREAYRRGNSVYLVDRVIPMLPRKLTEDVCSLRPNKDRLAHSVVMNLDAKGHVVSHASFSSVICSRMRLTYEQVQDVILDKARDDTAIPEDIIGALKEMHSLSRRLREQRAKDGAILFTMPEVRCVLDQEGNPVRFVKRMAYASYQLIEEFMLLANRTIAEEVAKWAAPVPYRIHEPPDEEQWARMAVDLYALGIRRLPQNRADLNDIALKNPDSPAAHMLNLAILRNLKRAMYAVDRKEHFGLAFSHYLHFTSPIRRYPDLIAHRVLRALEEKVPPPYSSAEIHKMAEHCSQTEREAAAAEEESVELKRIAYFARQLSEGKNGPFKAIVTSVVGRGLLVELMDSLQTGLVPFSSFADDYYEVNEDRNQARGQRTNQTWSIGDTLTVYLTRVDETRKLVDFHIAKETKEPRKGKKRKTKR